MNGSGTEKMERFRLTCIPITAYMKNSMTIKSATYGRA